MRRNFAAAFAALASGLAVAPLAYGQGYGYGYGPGMMGGYGWGGGGGFGIIGMLLWWVLIILGIVLIGKWLLSGGGPAGGRSAGDRALEILKERYARGEIDKNEFEQRKRDLSG